MSQGSRGWRGVPPCVHRRRRRDSPLPPGPGRTECPAERPLKRVSTSAESAIWPLRGSAYRRHPVAAMPAFDGPELPVLCALTGSSSQPTDRSRSPAIGLPGDELRPCGIAGYACAPSPPSGGSTRPIFARQHLWRDHSRIVVRPTHVRWKTVNEMQHVLAWC